MLSLNVYWLMVKKVNTRIFFYTSAMKPCYGENTKKITQTDQIVPDKSVAGTRKLLSWVTPSYIRLMAVYAQTELAGLTGSLFYRLNLP
jgi:hypothetical protein